MKDNKQLVNEQAQLKDKLIKLIGFINSDEFYKLSENNKTLLNNQRIGMEIYLNCLNARLYEDIDNVVVTNLGWMSTISNIFTSGFNFTELNKSEVKPE